MKRTLTVVVALVCLFIISSTAMAGRPIVVIKKPLMAVLPAMVDTGNYEISRSVEESVYEAYEQMGFRVVDPETVVEAARKLNIRLPWVSQLNSGVNIAKIGLLDEGDLLKIGRRLEVDKVAAARLKVWEKTTTHFPFGSRQNGRCTMQVIIVDVKKTEVLYEYPAFGQQSIEFGVAEVNDWKLFGGPIGGLAAAGILGNGRTTRTLGWAALIAAHTIKGSGGEQLQYAAAIQAINTVLGDFYSLYQYEQRSHEQRH